MDRKFDREIADFSDALAVLDEAGVGEITSQESNNPRLATELAAALVSKMTAKEKVHLLGGHYNYIAECLRALVTYKAVRFYNPFPVKGGGVKRLGVPSVAFTDGPRGVVMGRSTCFPTATVRAASFDTDLEERIGEAIAKEAIAGGANYFAGVCINLLRHPAWGRAQESYGEDQFLLGEMGAALTRAVQRYGVIACPKHYAMNSIENLRFKVNVTADDATLYDVYLPHFKACVDAGAGSIMGAYNLVFGEHACESRRLLTDILREEWGFEGFAISDFFYGIKDAARSLNAGLDMEMPTSIVRRFGVPAALRKGAVSQATVDECCTRIVATLLRFARLYDKQKFDRDVICCAEHTALARRAAEEGTVLLKNDGVLPVRDTNARIALVGRWADKVNVGDHGSSSVHAPYAVTPAQGFGEIFPHTVVSSSDNIRRALRAAENADVVVAVVGFSHVDEGEYILPGLNVGGDRKKLTLHKKDVALIRALAASGKPVVVVFYAGAATLTDEWQDGVSAILYAGYPGMEGGRALANIISGRVNPSGKLPFTVAKRAEDYPPFLYASDKRTDIEYGYWHGYADFGRHGKIPAYPFGFGLSYTTFSYADLKCAKTHDKLLVSVQVTNTGKVDGTEVVQVYAGSNLPDKPLKQLKGFARVTLAAGESKRVEIPVTIASLALYDGETGSMKVPAAVTVYAGGSSQTDKLLSLSVALD